MLSLKSSSEKNYELGGYIGNTLGHTLLAQPGTAQRFSPILFITLGHFIVLRYLHGVSCTCKKQGSGQNRARQILFYPLHTDDSPVH